MTTTAMLMTASHRILGRVRTEGERLQDLLNNQLSTCLQICDAQLFRQRETADPPIHFPELTVSKLLLNLVLLQEERHEAPAKRLYGYIAKNRYHTFLTVNGCEVQGCLHAASLPKPEIFLTDTTTSFVPLTEATVTTAQGVGQTAVQTWRTPVVFVRRHAIALFRAAIQ